MPSGVTPVEVRVGEKFGIELSGDAGGELPADELRWLASNDPVLDLREKHSGNSASIEATSTGLSVIQVQNMDNQIVKEFHITVFNPDQAATLNPKAGEPELK